MIKSFIKYIFLLGVFAFGLSSCGNDNGVNEQIQREWSVDIIEDLDGSRNNLLDKGQQHPWLFAYNRDEKQNYFTRIRQAGDTVSGSWLLKDDSTLLIEIIETSASVDSLNTEFSHTGDLGITLYDESGQKIGNLDSKGNFKAQGFAIEFQILNISNDSMRLQDEFAIYHLTYTPPETVSYISFETISRGFMGMLFLIVVAYLLSSNRKAINWSLVIKGLILQIVIAILVLKVPFVSGIFDGVAYGFRWLMEQASSGTNFLFESFIEKGNVISEPLTNFAFTILPTIVFFSALMSLLYYWGILQKIVFVFAWIMKKFMNLSGAESLAAAGNVFLGQTESPLLVKPYLMGMTKSEMMCLMTGGMATIAGGVLASYISFLGGGDPAQEVFYAKHLLTASVISAPAAIIAAKMLVPETESINTDLKINKEKLGTNSLEAIANGTSDGLKLAVNVGAMLLVFIALMAVVNSALGWFGGLTGLNGYLAEHTTYDELSLEMILGYVCGPVMWVLGIESTDMWKAGELLGTKTVVNEFVGYIKLGEMKDIPVGEGGISERTAIMCTYMLCGFANFASIGIQIGGIGSLVPSRKGLLSSLGFKALIGGTIACLFTMVVVGMLI
ncbi:MAG: Na+ dependent nucleoside transporter [Flavobacteriales bacterium]|nr:Na+ dependent nucleoside transporter [Flavobacteriales bacterium]